mmetsp:Transcript_44928/g.116804  ORF Transcript_44928/g.116804 Transcript_44928/m.116804 type:complete len:350 (+) Transcript_44928:287-1336(+)
MQTSLVCRRLTQCIWAAIIGVFLRKLVSAEANVDDTFHGGHAVGRARLAGRSGLLQGVVWAVCDIGVAQRAGDPGLVLEEQLLLGNPVFAHALPDGRPAVVGRIAIEIAAVAVLAPLRGHRDPRVDVVPLRVLGPPVDLKRHPQRQFNVEHFHRLSLAAVLQDSALAVILDADRRVRAEELVGERGQHRLPVPRRLAGAYPEHVRGAALVDEERAADGDLLRHAEAVGDRGRQVPRLDEDCLAPDEPEFARLVETHPLGNMRSVLVGGRQARVEGLNVRVPVDAARALRPRHRHDGFVLLLLGGRGGRWRHGGLVVHPRGLGHCGHVLRQHGGLELCAARRSHRRRRGH